MLLGNGIIMAMSRHPRGLVTHSSCTDVRLLRWVRPRPEPERSFTYLLIDPPRTFQSRALLDWPLGDQ